MTDEARICKRCTHADCAMERGGALPSPVSGAIWPDGRRYVSEQEIADARTTLSDTAQQAQIPE